MTLETYAQSPMTISTNFSVTYGTGYPKEEQVLFEPDNYNTDVTEIAGVWTAGTAEDKATYKVIVNPAKGGINTSAKCLEVTCRNNDGSIGIDFHTLLNQLPNLNGRRRISMLFKAGKNVKTQTPLGNGYYTQLQLETNYDSNGKQVYCLGAYYDAIDNDEAGHDGWKRLYFDFTPYNTTDNYNAPGYHSYVIGDYPYQLVFKPKICTATIGDDNRTITSHEKHTCSDGDVYYIDDIKIEDVPYAEGYWINDDTNLPKGRKIWHDAEQYNEWNTENCALPKNGSNGVLHLSGTWLKGENLVNPEIWEKEVVEGRNPWVYEFNEYRDLSWHVKPGDVKLMVFHKDSKLRWGDRGGLLGTNTADDVEHGYPARFIDNLNVLIFAEKSCILPDEVDNLAANWHDANAVIHYSDDSWKAWELELTDNYPFLNPQKFTVENLIKIHRGMIEGFNALVYPFSLTAGELHSSRVGTIYHHKDADKLYFVPKTETEANVPYITENLTFGENTTSKIAYNYQEFKGSRTVSTVDEGHAYASEAGTATLYGVYKRTNGNGKWGFVNGVFKIGGANSSFKTFRAYLDFPEGSSAKMFSSFNLEMMELTGVSMTDANNKDNNSDYVYDLYGRRYPRTDLFKGNLPRQIYIVDGKKVIK